MDVALLGSDDLASAAVHAGALALSLVLGARLWRRADAGLAKWAVAIFCAGWVALYAASVAYHLTPHGASLKPVALACDDGTILLVIAGSYTAVALLTFAGPDVRLMLIYAWIPVVLALAVGVVAASGGYGVWFQHNVFLLCTVQGWGPAILFCRTLCRRLPRQFAPLIVASGIVYVAGVFFYRAHAMPWHHTVWHVAVVIGSLLDFAAIRVLLMARRPAAQPFSASTRPAR